jgi:putative membrane protein
MPSVLLAEGAWPHHWWFLFVPLAWVIVIALVIRFVFMRRGAGCWSRSAYAGSRGPQDILAERYARGEIGDEEYRTRLDRLRADTQT